MTSSKTVSRNARKESAMANGTNAFSYLNEGIAFLSCYAYVRLQEGLRPHQSLTGAGHLNHYIVEPLFRWHGENNRILNSPSVGNVGVIERNGSTRSVVNGGSHNYAGFYALSPQDESLHRQCLDHLPVAHAESVPLLHNLMLEGLSKFFDTDCCYSTTTGYQANVLGIPAIADSPEWLIIVDEKSHNSIFTAAFAARAKATKRFKHNDINQLRAIIEADEGRTPNILVVVEGLYSMDGTIPPLDELYELKRILSFTLYADEAHSFGAIGKTGRGCLELWNDLHPENPLPRDVIDVRSAVLSKAVGGLGGFVAASARFSDGLRRRSSELCGRGESLTTSTMLQTLMFLHQPLRIRRGLDRLRNISSWAHEELERQGIRVYGATYVPMLPVYGGRPSKAAELSFRLRQAGLVASPVSIPAVEFLESRVRVTLSASYSDEDVNQMIAAIVEASKRSGLAEPSMAPPRSYRSAEELHGNTDEECRQAYERLEEILRQQILQFTATNGRQTRTANLDENLLAAGHSARLAYGLGSGSARWILGTFPPHLEVEDLITRVTELPSAITYPDSDLGLMSTVAGLCRPIRGCSKHYFLLPFRLLSTVKEGLEVASKKSGTEVIRYADLSSMLSILGILIQQRRTYVTLYVETATDGVGVELGLLADQIAARVGKTSRLTVLFNGGADIGAHRLAGISRILPARILLSGSFYHQFGLPGGYLAGDKTLIDELRYTSRCYMFTTSPMPFVMAMIKEVLLLQLGGSSIADGRHTIGSTNCGETAQKQRRRVATSQSTSTFGLFVLIVLLAGSWLMGGNANGWIAGMDFRKLLVSFAS